MHLQYYTVFGTFTYLQPMVYIALFSTPLEPYTVISFPLPERNIPCTGSAVTSDPFWTVKAIVPELIFRIRFTHIRRPIWHPFCQSGFIRWSCQAQHIECIRISIRGSRNIFLNQEPFIIDWTWTSRATFWPQWSITWSIRGVTEAFCALKALPVKKTSNFDF